MKTKSKFLLIIREPWFNNYQQAVRQHIIRYRSFVVTLKLTDYQTLADSEANADTLNPLKMSHTEPLILSGLAALK